MADSSLDDFFAKKDKSKKKSKSKIKPDEILAQQGMQGEMQKLTKKKKSKETKKTEVETENADKIKKDDEEWKDYAEEEKVDYTGLRIKEMQLAKAEEEREEEERNEEDEGEGRESREQGGPWNKVGDSADNTPTHVSEKKKAPEPTTQPESTKPAVGKYVPPSRRGEGGAAAAVSVAAVRRKKKEAPNLHSEHDFPTLGGADYTQGGEFEEVKSGGRQTEDPSKQRLNLQLDNKFGALENEDS